MSGKKITEEVIHELIRRGLDSRISEVGSREGVEAAIKRSIKEIMKARGVKEGDFEITVDEEDDDLKACREVLEEEDNDVRLSVKMTLPYEVLTMKFNIESE